MKIDEGYFTLKQGIKTADCDHGPCIEYLIPELGLSVFLYDLHPLMISIHPIESDTE